MYLQKGMDPLQICPPSFVILVFSLQFPHLSFLPTVLSKQRIKLIVGTKVRGGIKTNLNVGAEGNLLFLDSRLPSGKTAGFRGNDRKVLGRGKVRGAKNTSGVKNWDWKIGTVPERALSLFSSFG